MDYSNDKTSTHDAEKNRAGGAGCEEYFATGFLIADASVYCFRSDTLKTQKRT